MATRVYLAGPLFSEAEQAFNQSLVEDLEAIGCDVFLPQRDALDFSKPDFQRLPPLLQSKAIFESDKNQIYGADVFLFCLDGRVPDEGASVELGLAFAHREFSPRHKLIIGFRTDTRVAMDNRPLNAMLMGAFDEIFSTRADLIEYLEERADDFVV
ncbi:MAG: nucleoside 2-deoxyribosyltransferase [Acidimicrobiia bacterium]|nr:nucleoside 2-deoxyribosyltransferase [Acidimicrobiia bacterium]